MDKLTSLEHATAAAAAVFVTAAVVLAMAGLGYPQPAAAQVHGGLAAGAHTLSHCSPG